MNEEIIYFDGSCGMCTASAKRFERIVSSRGFRFEPFEGPAPDEMKLRTRDGQMLGGADALIYIAQRVWWAWPVWAISFVPGAMWMMRRVYSCIARNRYRISGSCRI